MGDCSCSQCLGWEGLELSLWDETKELQFPKNLSKLLLLDVYAQYPPAQGFAGNSPKLPVPFPSLGVSGGWNRRDFAKLSCCETEESQCKR